MIWRGTSKFTSSPASAAGRPPSSSPGGKAPSGPAPVPVSRFRVLESGKAMPTNDTSGPLFNVSSPSAALQRSLENRLRERLDVNGSPEYGLTWKPLDMPSGVPICRLAASARRTSDNAFGGWPTPQTADDNMSRTKDPQEYLKRMLQRKSAGSNLALTAQAMAGWATPAARDWKNGQASDETLNRNARPLNEQATMLAGWGTPRVGNNGGHGNLKRAADGKARLEDQVHGAISTSSPAPTGKRGALNPALPRWLQGYPVAWCQAAIRAHRKLKRRGKRG